MDLAASDIAVPTPVDFLTANQDLDRYCAVFVDGDEAPFFYEEI